MTSAVAERVVDNGEKLLRRLDEDQKRHEKAQKKIRKKVRKLAKRTLERIDRVRWMDLHGEAMDPVRSAYANAMKELRRIVECTKKKPKT